MLCLQIGAVGVAASVLQTPEFPTLVASASMEAATVLYHWLVGVIDIAGKEFGL